MYRMEPRTASHQSQNPLCHSYTGGRMVVLRPHPKNQYLLVFSAVSDWRVFAVLVCWSALHPRVRTWGVAGVLVDGGGVYRASHKC